MFILKCYTFIIVSIVSNIYPKEFPLSLLHFERAAQFSCEDTQVAGSIRAVASGVKGGDNSRGPHRPGGPTKSRNYTI